MFTSRPTSVNRTAELSPCAPGTATTVTSRHWVVQRLLLTSISVSHRQHTLQSVRLQWTVLGFQSTHRSSSCHLFPVPKHSHPCKRSPMSTSSHRPSPFPTFSVDLLVLDVSNTSDSALGSPACPLPLLRALNTPCSRKATWETDEGGRPLPTPARLSGSPHCPPPTGVSEPLAHDVPRGHLTLSALCWKVELESGGPRQASQPRTPSPSDWKLLPLAKYWALVLTSVSKAPGWP